MDTVNTMKSLKYVSRSTQYMCIQKLQNMKNAKKKKKSNFQEY